MEEVGKGCFLILATQKITPNDILTAFSLSLTSTMYNGSNESFLKLSLVVK